MKKSRYTDSQIMSILKQAEVGTPVPELCREHVISEEHMLMPARLLAEQIRKKRLCLSGIMRVASRIEHLKCA